MKSFSRIYPQSAGGQLEVWSPSNLEVELSVSPQGIHKEQILAILQNGEHRHADETRSRPVMRPLAISSPATAWQPEEIDIQPRPREVTVWDFVELPNEMKEDPRQETWQEQPDPEKEALTVLTLAQSDAEEIILEARATADTLIVQAQDQIELEKREGYQQGWNEARSELGETLKAVHAVLDEVRAWRDSLMTQGEPILVDMLKEIAQNLFGEGVRLDAHALQINLNRVMEHAQKLGDLNIFINTRDAELLDPSWSEYQLLITGHRVKIIPSEKITPGGCVVKGSMGMVDGRVETQLAAVMNTIDEISGVNK